MSILEPKTTDFQKVIPFLKEEPSLFDIKSEWIVLTEDSGENQYLHVKKLIELLNRYNIPVNSTAKNYIIVSTFESLEKSLHIEISRKSIYLKMKSMNYLSNLLQIVEKMIQYLKSVKN